MSNIIIYTHIYIINNSSIGILQNQEQYRYNVITPKVDFQIDVYLFFLKQFIVPDISDKAKCRHFFPIQIDILIKADVFQLFNLWDTWQ